MLDEVMVLFCQRYGLKEPDQSKGCNAIRGAQAGTVSIAELRRVLTEEYELYPQVGNRVLEILDELEETTAAVDSGVPATEEAAAVPDEKPTRRRRSKT